MGAPIIFFPARDVFVLDVGLADLISEIIAFPKDTRRYGARKLVAVHAQFNGGWYAFPVARFWADCVVFSELDIAARTEVAVKQIFDIHEYKQLPRVGLGAPPGESADQSAVVIESEALAGVWAPPVSVRSYLSQRRRAPPQSTRDRGDRVRIVDVDGKPSADPREAPVGFAEVRRTPHLDLSVATCPPVGERFEVSLFCDASNAHPDEFSQPISVYGPKEQNEFRIEAFLAPGLGLGVIGTSTGELLLRRDEMESKPLRFQVEVQKPPAGDGVAINAYFFYGGRSCGSVTRILPTHPSVNVPGTSGTLTAVRGAKAADLTVSVTRQSGTVGSCEFSFILSNFAFRMS